MYDAIVVGARCGGAPTAMLLARKGHQVLLIDRSARGSDIPHGHFIHRDGPRRLKEWGLLDGILDSGCSSVTSTITDFGDFPLMSTDLEIDGIPFGLAPRRTVLDDQLIAAAVDAGAEYRDNVVVDEFLASDGTITGINGRDRNTGQTFQENATITIGADGRNSHLARTVNAAKREFVEPLTFWVFSYFSDVASESLEIYARPGSVIFSFPTNDGLFGVFVAFPTASLSDIGGNFERALDQAIDQIPDFRDRVRNGRKVEPVRVMIDLPNIIRSGGGPGWALVGDAGIHKDPYMALGICDAFRDADYLAEAIDAGLTGRAHMDASLIGFESRRNSESLPDFHENLQRASLQPPPPEALAVRAAIRNSPADARDFMLAFDHHIPAEQFFGPANMQRIFMAAGMAPPGPPQA